MSLTNKIKITATAALFGVAALVGCQKMERPALGNYVKDANPPGGPLKFYTAFDGSDVDSIRANFALSNPLKFITGGVSGKAVQGERGKAIKYGSANDFKRATSFTIAWWMKQTPHADGPEFLFGMADKDYWANSSLFLLIEDKGQSTTSLATTKLYLMDQWFEFTGANRMTGNILNGNWHHVAIAYDQTTSKLTYYVDGAALTGLASSLTDVKNGANPRGALNLANGGNFIVGGWNKHVGLDGPTDSWINTYSGAMDQFRLYAKALTASEITALYNSKL
ncbi:MAG: LamG domain-containing protein [Chitinophagaceae bacterium]|nr:LamG domain-containing protein [Chitinophagaceae bacterium]